MTGADYANRATFYDQIEPNVLLSADAHFKDFEDRASVSA
jgi:hypothetical protein